MYMYTTIETTIENGTTPHIVQPCFWQERLARKLVVLCFCNLKSIMKPAWVVLKFPLEIHRKCAPDNFLRVRGTTTSHVGSNGGGYDDCRVRGDQRPARVCARHAPTPCKSRGSKERRIGNLTHLVFSGCPPIYLFAAVSTLPSAPSR